MQIKELLEAAGEIPPQEPAPAVTVDAEPTGKDVEEIQALLGTIDPVKEQPATLLNKLTGWLKDYPILDKVTDIIPQTRLIKAIALAVDSIEAGDNRGALAALAGGLTGGVGKAVSTLNTVANTGTALAQGDVGAAARAAGGNVAKLAKGADAAASLAQGNVAGAVGAVNKTAGSAVTALQAKLGAPVRAVEDSELARIRQLARV